MFYGLQRVVMVVTALCPLVSSLPQAQGPAPSPGEVKAMGSWVASTFAAPGPQPEPADSIRVVHQRNIVRRCRTPWDTPLKLAGTEYAHGIYMDSAAALKVTLAGPARAFVADVGIDDNHDTRGHPDKGSARFHVTVDGETKFLSSVLRLADGAVSVNVPLDGALKFVLAVDDGDDGIGWDQCDWGGAAVVMNDGTRRFLDEFSWVGDGREPNTPPFSFTYDGIPSSDLLTTWEYAVSEKAAGGVNRRTVSYLDPMTALHIDCEVTTYDNAPAVDWLCRLSNDGDADTPLIEQFQPLDTVFLQDAPESKVTLRWSNGDACSHDAFLPHDDILEVGKPRWFTPGGGRSSNGAFPFFNMWNGSTGWVLAMGWTGQWAAEFIAEDTGGVSVRAGMEKTRFRLRPGESVRTPRIVLLRWEGDAAIRGHNLFRRMMVKHYVPRRDGDPAAPPVAHNTAATIYQTGQPTNEANQLSMAAQASERGCEGYWLDAYWYPQPWHEHVGDWFPRPADFPHGLRPLSEAAHEDGMKFILWFEPERVREGTQWDREHPEFLLRAEGIPNRLFNLADPKARTFLTDFIDARVKEWGIDVYRQDFNFDPLDYWRENDAEDRQGITEMHYIEGLYRFWDELVARNPGITVDNCASGGRRIDIETCSRSYPLWRSDCNDIGEGLKGEAYWPYMGRADQVHGAGLSLYIPFHTGAVWDERPYAWRSAMNAGIVLYGDIEKFETNRTRDAIAELKELRPLVTGDFYLLTAVTTSQRDWYAYQLDRPDLGHGCAVFFRRPDSPYPECEVELQGIDPTHVYAVSITGETYAKAPEKLMPGTHLIHPGIRIEAAPSSVLLRYRKVHPSRD